VESILQAGDQLIHAFSIEVLQAFLGWNLLGIAEKAVDQIIENPEPKKGGAAVLGRDSQNMFEASIHGVSRIDRNRDPVAFHIPDAKDVEKKTGICRGHVFYHHRYHFPLF
jgi:hypothetical protein